MNHLNQALAVFSREAHPADWARSHYNLGQIYYQRLRGDRAKNLDQAIQHYRLALEVDTRQASPANWISLMNNLGLAYWERIAGDRAENLEQAIRCYQQVLEVRDRAQDPVGWAATVGNLGLAYSDRLLGDPAENIERAIYYYEQALQVRTRESMPDAWARTQSNLALAYMERLRGDTDENIERAIHHLNNTLAIRTRRAFPKEWADSHHNLGHAYSEREIGDRGANIEEAIRHYHRALEVLTPETYGEDWARTQNSLGGAYLDRQVGDRAQNLEQATSHYQNALRVYSREAYPEEWAGVQHNLGFLLFEGAPDKPSRNLNEAVRHFQAALSVFTYEAYPDRYRATQYKLGHAYFMSRQWDNAYRAHAAALDASEHLLLRSATLESRQLQQTVSTLIITEAAYAAARLDRPEEAVFLLEQGKARALAEALGRREASLDRLTARERASFDTARSRIGELEARARATGKTDGRSYLSIAAELRQARQALAELTAAIARRVPDFLPQGLDYQAIARLAADLGKPLVYLAVSEIGAFAIAVLPDPARAVVVWLEGFRQRDLDHFLLDSEEDEIRYLHAIAEGASQSLARWLQTTWSQIRSTLLEPLGNLLRRSGHEEAVLLPDGLLLLLPLPAMAIDDMHYVLAPSARAMQSALRGAAKRPGSAGLLAVGNPLPNPQPLAYAQQEARMVAALFGNRDVRLLLGREATRQAVLGTRSPAGYLHFSCHGFFDSEEPLDSALMLAGEDRLSLRAILDGELDLSRVRAVVLSACQTGITDFYEAPDEAIGFPSGLLQAGAPAVISTLWPVDDLSTMLLMERLYQLHLQEGLPLAAALRQAQLWIRDVTAGELAERATPARQKYPGAQMPAEAAIKIFDRFTRAKPELRPFSHPYYWAAFTFTGV
jgi:CHAT domain-containing protein